MLLLMSQGIISSALLIKDSKEGQQSCVAEELVFRLMKGVKCFVGRPLLKIYIICIHVVYKRH